MKNNIFLFRISVALLFISSMSVIAVFFSGNYWDSGYKNVLWLGGMFFWVTMLIGYALLALVNLNRKRFEMTRIRTPKRRRRRPGALSVFSNKYGMIADLATILFLIISVFFILVPVANKGVAVVCLAFLIFSFHMHCVLNGINYAFVKYLKDKENAG